MKNEYDEIPGWRRPNDKEHAHILEAWRSEVRPGMNAKAGKRNELISILLLIVGVLWFIIGGHISSYGIGIIVIATCFFFYATYEKWRQHRKCDFLMDLADRHYKIISGVTTKIEITGTGRHRRGYASVRIPGVFDSEKSYRVPVRQIRSYVEHEAHSFPVLFVRMRAYDTPFVVIYGDYI